MPQLKKENTTRRKVVRAYNKAEICSDGSNRLISTIKLIVRFFNFVLGFKLIVYATIAQ